MGVSVASYFHYPNGKSPEYEQLRQQTTDKYGYWTTGILVLVIIIIPIYNSLVKRGYYYHNKFKLLKRIENSFPEQTRSSYIIKFALTSIIYHLNNLLQILFWIIVLGLLSLTNLHEGDLIFLAKRLGRISANSLPVILLLSLKPSPLPNTLYLSLIPIHKWISRIIIIQSIFHAMLYCGFFNRNHTWGKALKPENIYGWAALSCFLLIFFTSLLRFRNLFYSTFFHVHYILTWIIVILLQYHIRPNNFGLFTGINLIILGSQICYRIYLTRISSVNEFVVNNISPNLLLIEFPNTLLKKVARTPGSHIRLTKLSKSNYILNGLRFLIPNYHPYTLVSLPNDRTQKLIVKKSSFKFENNVKYLINGSYDSNLLFVNNFEDNFRISKLRINTKRVLVIIGGSAISFALPILRVMNYHGIPIKIVWVIKDFRDIAILKSFDGYIHGNDIEIFVTGSETVDDLTSFKSMRSLPRVRSSYNTFDLELNQNAEYPNASNHTSRLVEDENVDISVRNEEDSISNECEEDDDCCRSRSNSMFDNFEEYYNDDNNEEGEQEEGEGREDTPLLSQQDIDNYDPSASNSRRTLHSHLSHKTNGSNHTNEHFVPKVKSANDLSRDYLNNYHETIKKVNLANKIYKGRPNINYRYFNWCLHEGFTQCSGPVEIGSNLVCCKDLQANNIQEIDLSKVWVVTAGPKGLVHNVKVWAHENGLKLHEEAFYT